MNIKNEPSASYSWGLVEMDRGRWSVTGWFRTRKQLRAYVEEVTREKQIRFGVAKLEWSPL